MVHEKCDGLTTGLFTNINIDDYTMGTDVKMMLKKGVCNDYNNGWYM